MGLIFGGGKPKVVDAFDVTQQLHKAMFTEGAIPGYTRFGMG